MVACIRQHASACHLGIESPSILGTFLGGHPGLSEGRGHQAETPDLSLLEKAAGFRKARPEPVLVPHCDLQGTSPGQPHDIGGLLQVCRQRLLDEQQMAPSLKGIHRQAVMPEVRSEDAQGIEPWLLEEPPMVVEAGHSLGSTHLPYPSPEGLGACKIGVGAADHGDLGLREQPIPVDPRRPAASGNPDPKH